MRDIKFRAWHKDNDSMVYFDNKKASKDMYIAMNLCALMNGDFGDVLMQYTGLKDKNGVEIYEGDILTGGVSGHVKPVVVEWSTVRRGSNVNGATTHAGFNISEYYITFSQCRVIGNIHQNPELLGN